MPFYIFKTPSARNGVTYTARIRLLSRGKTVNLGGYTDEHKLYRVAEHIEDLDATRKAQREPSAALQVWIDNLEPKLLGLLVAWELLSKSLVDMSRPIDALIADYRDHVATNGN